MLRLTKFSLKRPVTLILALVVVLYFGISSILSAPMELTPDMNLPMIIVVSTYPGASPEDINELVSKPLESNLSTLGGLDTISAYSMENLSMIYLQYEYGTDMDKAYLELRKQLDMVKGDLPEDVSDPVIYEMDINSTATMLIAITGGTDENLYNYVNDSIVPEFEKIADVGEVALSGGQESYISIELIPEKMSQYGLDINTIAALVGAADFSIPSGSVDYADQELNLTVSADYKDIEKIRNIVLPLATGDIIHLSDVANVSNKLEEADSISRYNSQDTISLSISKRQSSSAVDISKKVNSTLEQLKEENSNLNAVVIYDAADNIKSSLKSVFETLIIAVILAMLVLYVFFGDIKASLIVGSSIPVSVLLTLTLMGAADFSLNIVSVGSLALGVGMIVDNSIVVLESCFRTREKMSFKDAAIEGTGIVIGSIFGSTATTCVVFLPLALLEGLTGQIFKQLGFTIVFCMISSFFSAVTIVPLLYLWVKPVEKTETPAAKFMVKLQNGYRSLVRFIIPAKKKVILVTLLLMGLSIAMMAQLGMELIPDVDEGMIAVNITTRPGLKTEEVDKIMSEAEEFIVAQEDVDRYSLSYGGSALSMSGSSGGGSITAYLKKGRKHTTAELVSQWKKELEDISNATIEVSSSSSIGLNMLSTTSVEIDLQSTDYDLLKQTADEVAQAMRDEPYVSKVHTSCENADPVVKVTVDPVKAEAYGLTPASVAGTVYMNLSGKEVMNYSDAGNEVSVKLENPADRYNTVEDVESMLISTVTGAAIPLGDIADITFEDSAQTITRTDKQYNVSITAQIPEGYEDTAQDLADEFVDEYGLPDGISRAVNAYTEIITEELGALFKAILTAVFLVFIVMAMQFESPRLSLMVMFTIPFSMIGAFGFLFICNIKLSMVSMIGLLMMVGTVVNNGILYVDTVNQYREEMSLSDALVEAGATRIRPMLMTTLTTILAMIPMALALGNSGEMLQGLALVNIGGLTASTVLTLLLLPTVYQMFDKGNKLVIEE